MKFMNKKYYAAYTWMGIDYTHDNRNKCWIAQMPQRSGASLSARVIFDISKHQIKGVKI